MKNKIFTILIMVIAVSFMMPMVYAQTFSEIINEAIGVDISAMLVGGLSSGITSGAVFLGIYRIVKKPVNKTLNKGNAFLEKLSENFDAVLTGEKTINDFMSETKENYLAYQESIDQMVTELKSQNDVLKDEIKTLKTEFTELKEIFLVIKNTNIDIEEILKLGFGNIKELVENGIANKINKVGEDTDESEF